MDYSGDVHLAGFCGYPLAATIPILKVHKGLWGISLNRDKPRFLKLHGSVDAFDAWNVFICIFEDFLKNRL